MRSPTHRLLDVIRILRTVDPEIPLLYCAIFLEVGVAHPKPVPMNDLPEKYGVTRATISRLYSYLSSYRFPTGAVRKPGHGLIKGQSSEADRRCLELTLTTKGKTMYDQVVAAMERK